MGALFLIIFFLVAVFIVGLVLLQEGKGGGLTGMSTGMDGVMGARNPLRRMTAWLFAIFVLMCITINWYFHQRVDKILPSGAVMPANQLFPGPTPDTPAAESMTVPESELRPEAAPANPAPIRPESAPADEAPAAPVRPEPVEDSVRKAAEPLEQAIEELEETAQPAASAVEEAASVLRPETAEIPAPAQPVQPPAAKAEPEEELLPVAPPPEN